MFWGFHVAIKNKFRHMKIGGFQKQSLIDYPGNISSVVFTQGCNFRCGYCHNPELVLPHKFAKPTHEELIFTYLKKYNRLLDAVCITGGEPTLQKDLPEFIGKIKQLELRVKLDTNGTNPAMLKSLFHTNMVDFIAMDIKHLMNIESYNKVVGIKLSHAIFERIHESMNLIRQSGIAHEFRTTVAKGLHSISEIQSLKMQFGRGYKIQNFKISNSILNQSLGYEPFLESDIY